MRVLQITMDEAMRIHEQGDEKQWDEPGTERG